jgi:hypothetical protein
LDISCIVVAKIWLEWTTSSEVEKLETFSIIHKQAQKLNKRRK